MSTRVRSYSKINLGLAVGPLRADGFHSLTTMYQTLGLHDLVTVDASPASETSIVLTANHPGVPRTETGDATRNTAYAIVAKALEHLRVTANVSISLEKRLPVQGGMGAGSANAVAALIGLERELGLSLPQDERLVLAAKVGSDVPLFLIGGAVLGVGRGEQVSKLPDLPETWCVVAVPSVGVLTKLAFAELDKRVFGTGGEGRDGTTNPSTLTFTQANDRLSELSRVLAAVLLPNSVKDGAESGLSGITWAGTKAQRGDLAENPLLALVRTGIENDFEEVAFSQHPSLRSTKRDLQGSDPGAALYACLSGSGSALFGLYANHADALAAQQRVQSNGTAAFVTTTLPRQQYWDTMFAG